MNSRKLSSSKELTIVPPTKTSTLEAIRKHISNRLRALFLKQSPNRELTALSTTQNILVESKINPLEDMMNHITIGVAGLPDESIITLARGLHIVFGKGIEQDRKTKIKYINYVIMPFIGEGEELPTMLIANADTIIDKFRSIVKERVAPIMKQKVARLH